MDSKEIMPNRHLSNTLSTNFKNYNASLIYSPFDIAVSHPYCVFTTIWNILQIAGELYLKYLIQICR